VGVVMTTSQRKLATILAADAAAYSRLMGDDEKAHRANAHRVPASVCVGMIIAGLS
jgi:hypothetical protein